MSTILITGANRGIGLALAEAALDRGDRVVATARNPASASELAGLAAKSAGRLVLIDLDVANSGSTSTLGKRIEAAGIDRLDIVINNAGVIGPQRQSTLDMDFDGFAETLAINTLGPLRVVQAVLPLVERGEGGRILTVTSAMGSMSHTRSDRIAYRTSKAAVNKLMQGLATDLVARGIVVAVAHPGWVRTDMGGSSADIAPRDSARGLLAVIDRMEAASTGAFYNWSGERLPY